MIIENINNEIKKKLNYNKNHISKNDKYEKYILNKIDKIDDNNSNKCLICSCLMNNEDPIWNCNNCLNYIHLTCIKNWLKKINDKVSDCFNCPFCLHKHDEYPKYKCFCNKISNPKYNTNIKHHSCGLICNKKLNYFCIHKNCELACHPGKCNKCNEIVDRSCLCGKKIEKVECHELTYKKKCNIICNKTLNCGKHICKEICHKNNCLDCMLVKNCYCGKINKKIKCSEDFNCDNNCGKLLNCKNHICENKCHPGECNECPNKIKTNETCYCGKNLVTDLIGTIRSSCSEELPNCADICLKKLECGHLCQLNCHSGPCDCKQKKECNCSKKLVNCLMTKTNKFKCDIKCTKKYGCKMHKCNETCCNKLKHICKNICGKMLGCNMHYCKENCHKGPCKQCKEKLNYYKKCNCGSKKSEFKLCNSEIPYCDVKCNKLLECGHICYFNCHDGECPPCQELLKKVCKCGKTSSNIIKCCKEVICSYKCKEKLLCNHLCNNICHIDNCVNIIKNKRNNVKNKIKNNLKLDENLNNFIKYKFDLNLSCLGICNKIKNCSHPCTSICHFGYNCPKEKCNYDINIYCKCKNNFITIKCNLLKKDMVCKCNDICYLKFRINSKNDSDYNFIYYPSNLVNFVKNNFNYVLATEKLFNKFSYSDNNYLEIKIKGFDIEKINYLKILIIRHYYFNLDITKINNNYIFKITKNNIFIIPKVSLSKYNNVKEIIKPDISIKIKNISFVNIHILDDLLIDKRDKYYIENIESNYFLYIWFSKDNKIILKDIKNYI